MSDNEKWLNDKRTQELIDKIKEDYLSKSEVPYTASKVETGYIEDTFSANGSGSANITFSSPMPDTDYLVVTDCDRVGVEIGIINKTVNGFTLVVANNNVSELLIRVDYTAFELFELTTIAEIESDISTRLKIVFDMSDIESPAENQTVLYMGETTTTEPIYKQGGIYEYDGTAWQLKSADNITLDDALDTTSNNAVKNSVITQAVNKRLVVTDTMPTASAELLGQTRLYIGSTTTNYQEGGIYKCESDGQTPPTYSWNIKNKADIDLSLYKKIFTGTQATWNTLTDEQKKEYDIANITDDTEDSVVDEVADGDMRAVTSNAVYDVLSDDTESTSIVERNFGGMVYLRIPSTVSCASVFSAIIGNKILKVGSGSSGTYVIGYYGTNPINNISFMSGTMKLSGGSTVVKSFQYNGSDAIGETVTLIGVVYTE